MGVTMFHEFLANHCSILIACVSRIWENMSTEFGVFHESCRLAGPLVPLVVLPSKLATKTPAYSVLSALSKIPFYQKPHLNFAPK